MKKIVAKIPFYLVVSSILYISYTIFNTKIQLNIIAPSNSSIDAISEDNKKIEFKKTSFTENNKLIITNINKRDINSKGNETFFTAITTEHGGRIVKPESYTIQNGKWEIIGNLKNGGKWFSNTPGSQIIFEGNTSSLEIDIVKHPYSGTININWNDQDLGDINLYSKDEIWQKIHLETKNSIYYTLLPTKIKEIHFNQPKSIKQIQLTFGNQIITQIDNFNNDIFKIDESIQKQIILTTIKNIISLISKILLLNFIYFLIGIPFTIFVKKLDLLSLITISTITGLSFFLVVNNTITYFTNIHTSVLISFFLYLIICFIYFYKFRKIKLKISPITFNKEFIYLFIVAITSVVIVFFPSILEPNWFFGHSYTDSFEYSNLSQIFLEISPKDYGFPIGIMRFAETLFIGINSVFLNAKTTLGAYSISAAALWFQLPFLSFLILKKIIIKNNKTILYLFTLIISFSANIYSLFSQSYFAQFFFIFTLIYSFLITLILINQISNAKINLQIIIICSIIYSMAISIYPYHFFLPLSLFITYLITLTYKKNIANFTKIIFFIGILTIVITNINLLPVFNFSKTSTLNDKLNGIGQYIVFPFYKEPITFGSKILGLSDLVLNSSKISSINEELFGSQNLSKIIFNKYSNNIQKIILLLSIFFFLLGTVSYTKNKNTKNIFLLSTTILYLIVLIYLFSSNQIYPFGKLCITLGTITLINIFSGITFLLNLCSKNKYIDLLIIIFLSFFFLLNVKTIFVDNSVFYLNRNSYLLYKLRTHVSTNNINLKEFEHFITPKLNKKNKNSFLIIGSYDDLYMTDKDRVTNNRILEILSNAQITYNCNNYNHIYYDYDFNDCSLSNINSKKDFEYILIFNGYKSDKTQSYNLIYKNDIFKLYEKQ